MGAGPTRMDLRLTDKAVRTGGLVDLQVNGFGGVDFNTPGLTVADLDRALSAMLATGVTRCLPTVISAPDPDIAACLAALEAARPASRLGHMVLGYHLEGPFLSPLEGFRGCHPEGAMQPASLERFERFQQAAGGRIRLVTIAPEVAGALDLIAALAGRGIVVAIGHTAADRGTLAAAVDRGARLSTHLGNGTAGLLRKSDNPIMNQLAEDRLWASFIADGVHIAPDYLKVYVRAKGLDRSILVSDATAGAAAAPGTYRMGPVPLRRDVEPVVRLAGSTALAGSALTMDQAVRNAMAWFGLALSDAVALARRQPLTLLGEPEPADDTVLWAPGPDGPTVLDAGPGTA